MYIQTEYTWYTQGCPIGIPKNPEISGSSRKSLLGAAEGVHEARAKYRESKVGRGGVVAEPSKKKSVDSAINHFCVRRLKQAIKIRRNPIFP